MPPHPLVAFIIKLEIASIKPPNVLLAWTTWAADPFSNADLCHNNTSVIKSFNNAQLNKCALIHLELQDFTFKKKRKNISTSGEIKYRKYWSKKYNVTM